MAVPEVPSGYPRLSDERLARLCEPDARFDATWDECVELADDLRDARALLAEAERVLARALPLVSGWTGLPADYRKQMNGGRDAVAALLAKLKAHRKGAGENDADAAGHTAGPAATPALSVTRDELRALIASCMDEASKSAWCDEQRADRVLSRWLAERGER